MAKTLADLLTTPSEDDLRQSLLSDLNAGDFPITDWESGATLKTYVFMLARAYLVLLGRLIPKIAAGGFASLADDDWIDVTAKEVFGLDRTEATFTIQQATLICEAGSGPYTLGVGDVLALTTAGRRYTSITGGSLASGGTLVIQVQSEGPNDSTDPASNYIDGADTMTQLITPLPGVTINNPAIDFSPVISAGVATALMSASRSDPLTQPTAGTILVRIESPGQVGEATFSYRRVGLDLDFVAGGVVGPFVVPAVGAQLAFSNGNVVPTFMAGDLFSVSSPGGPILVQGRDRETTTALAARCLDRFPALSEIPTDSHYRLWALAADRRIVKVGVAPDPLVPNKVNVTIGGQKNPLAGDVILAAQSYIDVRTGGTEFAAVSTAVGRDVSISGSVVVPIGQSAAAKASADEMWQEYIAAADLGGTARLQALRRILGDAGATDVSSLAIAGANAPAPPTSSPNVNLTALPNEVLSIPAGQLPSQALAWYEA